MGKIYNTYVQTDPSEDWKLSTPSGVIDLNVYVEMFDVSLAAIHHAIIYERPLHKSYRGKDHAFKIIEGKSAPVTLPAIPDDLPAVFDEIVSVNVLEGNTPPVVSVTINKERRTAAGFLTIRYHIDDEGLTMGAVISDQLDLYELKTALKQAQDGDTAGVNVPLGLTHLGIQGELQLVSKDGNSGVQIIIEGEEKGNVIWEDVNDPLVEKLHESLEEMIGF